MLSFLCCHLTGYDGALAVELVIAVSVHKYVCVQSCFFRNGIILQDVSYYDTRIVKVKSAGVTVELTTKYRATVYSDRGELFLRSRIVEQTSRLAKMHVELFNADGTLGSEADVVYRIFPENVARQRLGWTGIEAFYPEETE